MFRVREDGTEIGTCERCRNWYDTREDVGCGAQLCPSCESIRAAVAERWRIRPLTLARWTHYADTLAASEWNRRPS